MKQFHSSVVVAIVAACGALVASVPAFRALWRSGGSSTVRVAPVEVNKEYRPSGWMGDAMGDATSDKDVFQADFQNTERIRPGGTGSVMRFSYKGGPLGWVGIAWQFPANNWGDNPGLNIRGAKKLTFWAVGAKGGETLEFKVGGARDPTKRYRDSFEKSRPTVLTKEWIEYTIDLSNADLTNIIIGFIWVAAKDKNQVGMTFFLDSVRFE